MWINAKLYCDLAMQLRVHLESFLMQKQMA